MKELNLEQGTQDWLTWRKSVITATECSVIMGSNPWDTPYMIWGRKLGLIPEKESNEAMERGKRLEPIIRERFIRKYGLNMTPTVVESSQYNFLGASLDGLSDCGRFILEVKTGGQKLYKMAQEGIIPEYYIHQMQHQLLVTEAEKCFYQVGDEDEANDIVIEVIPDPEFEDKYMTKAREFWRCVAFEEAPPLQEKDYKNMDNDSEWMDLSKRYQELDCAVKMIEQQKDSIRKELIELCKDQNCTGNGIKVMKMTVKGRIPYDSIPEIKAMDLEGYRKPSTTCWKILTKSS